MNNKQKKTLCLALLLTSAPAVVRAMGEAGLEVNVEIHADPINGPVNVEIPADLVNNPEDQPAAPRLNMYRRALGRMSDARQATQERWDNLGSRTKTATKVVASAGVLGAVGFLGHKLYKWWTKPVVTVEEKTWEARFFDFNESALTPVLKAYAPEVYQDLDAVMLRSVVSEAVETLQPQLLLENDAFVGLLTPEQKVELEEICALAEVEASRA